MMTRTTSRTGPFDSQPNDTLALVLSFLDFESSVKFTQTTSNPLTLRFSPPNSSFAHVWRSVFKRHYFSPPIESTQSIDYIQECESRRSLVKALVGNPNKPPRHCFNLPNRFFCFLPITPNDDSDIVDMDPPPVDYDCTSFLLISPTASGELLFLDPFDMSLSVYQNVKANAIASDEGMMAQAMLSAASAVTSLQHSQEREEHVAGAVIEDTVIRNHSSHDHRSPPSQVLISADDYFNVNLAEYFEFTNNRNARRRTSNGRLVLHSDDEVDFGYMGIEAKPLVCDTGELEGSMIGLGRFLTSLRVDENEDTSCTEVVTWTRPVSESNYGNMRICRVAWDIYGADTCPKHNRIYVVFYRGQGPPAFCVADDFTLDDTDSSSPIGQYTVVAYPLMATSDETEATMPRYFPTPEFSITCSDYVSYVTVDCSGTLVVGTNNGTIEVWKSNIKSRGMMRVTVLKSREALRASAKRLNQETIALSAGVKDDVTMDDQDVITEIRDDSLTVLTRCSIGQEMDTDLLSTEVNNEQTDGGMVHTDEQGHLGGASYAGIENDEPVLIENDEEDDQEQQVPSILGTPAIDSFHFPSHLPIEACGFVSLHYSRIEGTTLILWKKPASNTDFQVVSQINLPLSSRRKPRIHYDGRRIVVLGEDHIGVILLVYQVFSSNEDADYFPPKSRREQTKGDDSGGVYNFSLQRPRVRFANRIRHAALGGLERFEEMYMTCNERYIIVNTKTGNLLGGGASPRGDGLLIIDLQDEHS